MMLDVIPLELNIVNEYRYLSLHPISNHKYMQVIHRFVQARPQELTPPIIWYHTHKDPSFPSFEARPFLPR